jgi:hypothetical protein
MTYTTLLDMSDNSNKVCLLLLDTLGDHVEVVEADGRWQELSFYSGTTQVDVGAREVPWDLPTEKVFECPYLVELLIHLTFRLSDCSQNLLRLVQDLFGRCHIWKLVENGLVALIEGTVAQEQVAEHSSWLASPVTLCSFSLRLVKVWILLIPVLLELCIQLRLILLLPLL